MAIDMFGLSAVLVMVLMYALEARSPAFILGFAVACVAASLYALLIHAWPFAAAEAIWAVIALQRWRRANLAWKQEKGAIYRQWIQNWVDHQAEQVGGWSFEEIREIRETCIAALAQSSRSAYNH